MEIFAHRGGSVESLGNTLGAVLRSFAIGVNVEIDVTACANALVCTHHDKIGGDAIESFNLEDLRQYRLGPSGCFVFDPCDVHGAQADRIPTLIEVLMAAKLSPAKPKVLLDLKRADIRNRVADVVRATETVDQVIFGIHRPDEVEKWGDVNPDCLLAFCSLEDWGTFCEMERLGYIRLWQHWPELVDRARIVKTSGHKLCIMAGSPTVVSGGTCTVNSIKNLEALGADMIILNDPSLALAALS